ncbi:MAG: Rpn family recombination-promoting nuclease/putative transposase [Bacteroidetes bacterium]|nr:Rpn family recombination-promoting nuclease/putative transposase [Bacteroidota bacterium]
MSTRSMISFDWALKRLLRNKANFGVLEGFLSELLRRKIVIKSIAESEGNQQDENDKYNRVDLFVEDNDKELVIIELQFFSEYDYFQRMLYGVSKSITEYIHESDNYDKVRKVYSINIVYFDLGKGNDYIYHGTTRFTGLHTHEELQLSEKQRSLYNKESIGELYPEYYILKVKNFNDVAKDTFDEWMYYLKNNAIKDDFTAQGLDQARKVLVYDNLTDAEKRRYNNQIEATRIKNSEIKTAFTDGEIKGEIKGETKERLKIAKNAKALGLTIEQIQKLTNLTKEEIDKI